MKSLHKIIEKPALDNAQLASIWVHLIFDMEEDPKSTIYIDTVTGDVSYGIKEMGQCTMDHEQEWVDNGTPYVDTYQYNIIFWNSDEESA